MNTARITRPEARILAEAEFVRFAEMAASLTPDEWACTSYGAACRSTGGSTRITGSTG